MQTKRHGEQPANIGPSEASTKRSLPYHPALDGLRGLAVAAVLAYHADFSLAKGGFLGVDTFFVLSGYLITNILLAEWHDTGNLNLPAFWLRRARRLLPAMFLMLAGVAVYAIAFAEPDELDKIRSDSLATIAYFVNWHNVFSGASYFDQFSLPSPLRHTWSLAIEEQFYLAWPIALLVLFRYLRGSPRTLIVCSLVLIAGSVALMAWLYDPGSDPSRVYYGTDTRAHSLLVGAVLAMLLFWNRFQLTDAARRILQYGAVALAITIGWVWVSTPDDSPFLYRGGYALFAAAVAWVIAAVVVQQRGLLANVLSTAPLRLLGLISYGVYLWHWPIYLTLTAERTGLSEAPLFIVRVALTLAIAIASYIVLETPIRRGAIRWNRMAWIVPPATAAVLVVLLVVVTRGGTPPFAVPDRASAALTSLALDDDATRALLIGDSMAKSMSVGLYAQQEELGFAFRDASANGCGVMPGDAALFQPVGDSYCSSIRQRWQPHVDLFDPDVVVILTSAWDGVDHQIDGRTVQKGSAEWEEQYAASLRAAVEVLSSQGAKVAIVTAPYSSAPQIDAAMVDSLNAVGRLLAEESGDLVTVIDLNRYLSPDGTYSDSIGDVKVRSRDSVHFSEEGSNLIGAWLAPQIIEIGQFPSGPTDGTAVSGDGTLSSNPTGNGNYLQDAGVEGWQAVSSELERSGDTFVASSEALAYGAFQTTEGSTLAPTPGETYAALVWVRSADNSARGQIRIFVREDGLQEGESTDGYGLTGDWQPIIVEHTVTNRDPAFLSVYVLRHNPDGNAESLEFRDAELRLISE